MVRNLADLLTSFFTRDKLQHQAQPPLRDACLACGADLTAQETYIRYRVCPACGFHYSLTARERIELLADPGSFKERNRTLSSLDPLSFSSKVSYRRRLFRDQRRTGLTEAAVTGQCAIGGVPAMLIILDFSFLGGSMGCVVGEKVALALEHAAKKRLPVVAIVTSGGARVQEGVLSLMQMAKTATAANYLHKAGVPFVTVLASPAIGPAYASFANLADIILAEPGALVGFAPLRTVEEATGTAVPEGSHTAESHLAHGMIDSIVDRVSLREFLAVLLDLLRPRFLLAARGKKTQYGQQRLPPPQEPWHTVQLARHRQRPTSLGYIRRMVSSFLELHGDRAYGDDPAVVCGLGFVGGQSIAIIGQERGHEPDQDARRGGRMCPEGYRKAQRVMRLAAKFHIPVLTLIDTPGAYAGLEAEERGTGNVIATTLATMADLPTPIIAAIIGEGGSGGALALGVADRILMLQNAIYSPISPEGAASLFYRDEGRAEELAASLKLTAADCQELGIIDTIVPEPEGGAHTSPEHAARHLERAILHELSELQPLPVKKLLKGRYEKFRNMGAYNSYVRTAIVKEVTLLGEYVRSVRLRRKGSRGQPSDDVDAPDEET